MDDGAQECRTAEGGAVQAESAGIHAVAACSDDQLPQHDVGGGVAGDEGDVGDAPLQCHAGGDLEAAGEHGAGGGDRDCDSASAVRRAGGCPAQADAAAADLVGAPAIRVYSAHAIELGRAGRREQDGQDGLLQVDLPGTPIVRGGRTSGPGISALPESPQSDSSRFPEVAGYWQVNPVLPAWLELQLSNPVRGQSPGAVVAGVVSVIRAKTWPTLSPK